MKCPRCGYNFDEQNMLLDEWYELSLNKDSYAICDICKHKFNIGFIRREQDAVTKNDIGVPIPIIYSFICENCNIIHKLNLERILYEY